MAAYLLTIRSGLPETEQKRHLISLVVAMLMLFSVLLVDYHHHADGHDHPDCSICAVGHHKSAITTAAAPFVLVLPTSIFTPFKTLTLFILPPWNPRSPQSRAPPA